MFLKRFFEKLELKKERYTDAGRNLSAIRIYELKVFLSDEEKSSESRKLWDGLVDFNFVEKLKKGQTVIMTIKFYLKS